MFFLLVVAAGAATGDIVDSQLHRFKVVVVANGLVHPWGMVFLPDGDILVTERGGTLRRIHDGEVSAPINGLPPINAVGQGGLMDIALHPGFADNGWIYFTHTVGQKHAVGTELSRAHYDGYQLTDLERLFVALPKASGGRHFGSRVRFLKDGTLLLTLGDRGDRWQAQRIDTHLGGTIHLTDDGRIPQNNPFTTDPKAISGLYTHGHRNAQGLAIHPDSGKPWLHEHGPKGGDELNILHAGKNYGWPRATYGRNYFTGTKIGLGSKVSGTTQPLYYWVPSIAPSGMDFYIGDSFPNWRGNLFIGALKHQSLVRLQLSGELVIAEERLLHQKYGRIRDVRSGQDGLLYLLTDAYAGQLLCIHPID